MYKFDTISTNELLLCEASLRDASHALLAIKIEARRGKSAIEIQKALEEVGSEFVFPYSSITRWVRQLNNGRNTISNKHLCERPLSATTGENVEMLQNC